jgi:septum formation protein
MLRALSDTRHRVVTGVCVVRCRDGARCEAFERTWVVMRSITPAEIEAYVACGEWRDKAGGYAIQEHADAFVVSLEEGGFDNVVGLPVVLTLGLLARLEDDGGPGLARLPDRG